MKSLLIVFLGAVLLAGTSFAQEMETNDIDDYATVSPQEVADYLGGNVNTNDIDDHATVSPQEVADYLGGNVDTNEIWDPIIVIQPRVTCDLLSYWGVGNTACAAHCIFKGYKGGWCDSKKVCNCRR